MKEFNYHYDLIENGPKEVVEYLKSINLLEPNPDYIDPNIPETASFEHQLGGKIYIIETYDDLKLIPTTVYEEDSEVELGGWKSIVESASQYDICEYTPDGTYVLIWLATNDSGGPSYFIPRAISDMCSNIELSMKWTNSI